MPAVSVEHLAKSYGDTVAVRDVSFEVHKGEVFALLGPNGAGKTTTVEILEGFRPRSGGRVQTLGVDPADPSTQRWLRTRIGVVLQELAIEPYYSSRARSDAERGLLPEPRPVDEVIELIGLAEKADDRVKRLRAASSGASTSGSGSSATPSSCSSTSRRPASTLGRAATPGSSSAAWPPAGTTVLLTTHYMDEVEALADRVAVLFGQEIVASGTPSSIGGRDLGAVTIRFRLPEGVDAWRSCPWWRSAVERRPRGDPHRGRAAGAARPDRVGAGGRPRAAGTVGAAGVAGGHLPRARRGRAQ